MRLPLYVYLLGPLPAPKATAKPQEGLQGPVRDKGLKIHRLYLTVRLNLRGAGKILKFACFGSSGSQNLSERSQNCCGAFGIRCDTDFDCGHFLMSRTIISVRKFLSGKVTRAFQISTSFKSLSGGMEESIYEKVNVLGWWANYWALLLVVLDEFCAEMFVFVHM